MSGRRKGVALIAARDMPPPEMQETKKARPRSGPRLTTGVRFVYADPTKQSAPKLLALPARVIPQAAVGGGPLGASAGQQIR
jgi:hypothetical protein